MLSPSIIEKIVPLYKSGLTYQEVADKLNISIATVGRYVNKSGYDRVHKGGVMSRSCPNPKIEESKDKKLVVTSRTLKLHSPKTNYTYTASTDSDLIEIESDSCLMAIKIDQIDSFIDELKNIKQMFHFD